MHHGNRSHGTLLPPELDTEEDPPEVPEMDTEEDPLGVDTEEDPPESGHRRDPLPRSGHGRDPLW